LGWAVATPNERKGSVPRGVGGAHSTEEARETGQREGALVLEALKGGEV
jgi:hypothetical protein